MEYEAATQIGNSGIPDLGEQVEMVLVILLQGGKGEFRLPAFLIKGQNAMPRQGLVASKGNDGALYRLVNPLLREVPMFM